MEEIYMMKLKGSEGSLTLFSENRYQLSEVARKSVWYDNGFVSFHLKKVEDRTSVALEESKYTDKLFIIGEKAAFNVRYRMMEEDCKNYPMLTFGTICLDKKFGLVQNCKHDLVEGNVKLHDFYYKWRDYAYTILSNKRRETLLKDLERLEKSFTHTDIDLSVDRDAFITDFIKNN
jgi:hypothetical protein